MYNFKGKKEWQVSLHWTSINLERGKGRRITGAFFFYSLPWVLNWIHELKLHKKRKGRSSSWIEFSLFPFFDDLQHIYLNSLRVKDFSYGEKPLERYLILFLYLKYGTCLFNGTSRQQAYSCMWPSTRPILGAKGWTNSRGLVHWGQHHMKPLALPFDIGWSMAGRSA